jgi:hypothetical protein
MERRGSQNVKEFEELDEPEAARAYKVDLVEDLVEVVLRGGRCRLGCRLEQAVRLAFPLQWFGSRWREAAVGEDMMCTHNYASFEAKSVADDLQLLVAVSIELVAGRAHPAQVAHARPSFDEASAKPGLSKGLSTTLQ